MPKPVTSIVVKRHRGAQFRVGFAEMNGWRKSMEDAHIIHCRDTWGFFGVFDGHGGDQCSEYVARRFVEELEKGPPEDDAAVKELSLRVDREFLATGTPSGSTGTFCIVKPPTGDEEGYLLRVGNIGDSRVMLGRADGTIVDGGGTEQGLTTDHKPDHPGEKERINRTGGYVELVMGVPRVNGDLAVSRSFGDGQYKTMGGPRQEDHPVSAEPEFTTLRCNGSDFLMLVCDGISEGEFPNPEVVKLAAKELAAGGDNPDPGAAAAAVCRQAMRANSKDNLSCMIVLLGAGGLAGEDSEYIPGPFGCPDHGAYRRAYAEMAKHSGLKLSEAVERRYDVAVRELEAAAPAGAADEGEEALGEDSDAYDGDAPSALRQEVAAFGKGPPKELVSGSEDRIKWFSDWLGGFQVKEDPDPSNMTRDELTDLLHQRPDLMAMAQAHGLNVGGPRGGEDSVLRHVRVAKPDVLRKAVAAVPSLKWSSGYEEVCGTLGMVVKDDPSDGTSQVKFPTKGILAWLPTSALTEVDESEEELEEDGRAVKVACSVEELKQAVEASKSLKWMPRLAEACGKEGVVVRDDSDGTSQVRFEKPIGFTAWLPISCLTAVGEGGPEAAGESAQDSGESAGEPGRGAAEDSKEGAAPAAAGEGETTTKRQRTD